MSSKLTRPSWIRSLFKKPVSTISSRRAPGLRPSVWALEDRITPQATLYIDYGDSLPVGGLSFTTAQLISAQSGSNPAVNGPDITFAGSSAVLTWDSYASLYGSISAANRTEMTNYVRRLYEPYDIAVVELTPTPQIVNGHSVHAAASLADISVTLGANNGDAKHKDNYAMVGQWFLDGTDFIASVGAIGISNGSDLIGLGGGANNTEGSVICAVSDLIRDPNQLQDNTFNGGIIAHESGHSFGLGHVYPNFDVTSALSPGLALMGEGDVMSYNRVPGLNGVDQMTNIMRYPTMRGNGVRNPNLLSPTQFQATSSGEQFILDPEIGANPNLEFVSGTGTNDKITIQKTGANTALVTVEAFEDSGYTTPTPVPGASWPNQLSYSFTINLSKPLLIDGGASDDQITIDANLGIDVRIRGGSGNDTLIINGTGSENLTYTLGTNTTPNEFDGQENLQATIVTGGKTISLSEFESTSSFTINNVGDVAYISPKGNNTILAAGLSGGVTKVTGTIGSGIPTVPLFVSGKSLAFDLSGGTTPATKNTLTFDFTSGNPVPVNGASYIGGAGLDKIVVGADTNFTLSNSLLDLGTLGKIALTSVESAALTGGKSDNIFTISGWTGVATVDGQAGTDTINFTQNSDITLTPASITTSTGTVIPLTSIENAVLNGGASANIFDLTGWSTSATVNGLGGNDTIKLTRNTNFTATDTLISLSDGTKYTVSSIELAVLTGGAGNNIFDLNGWSGGGTISGLNGTDEVRVTRDADMTLGAGSLSLSAGLPINLSSVENAKLNGGASGNTFTVSGWTGNVNIDGKAGADTYIISPASTTQTIAIADTGADSAQDSLQFFGTSGNDTYSILLTSIQSGGLLVSYTGIENVSINGLGGDDTFVTDISQGLPSGTFAIDGGTGVNTLAITGTPILPVTQSGVIFNSTTTGTIFLDPNGSITPTLTGPFSGDETVIPFSNMSKIGDTTPAARFNFAYSSTNDNISVTDGGVFSGVPTVQVYDGINGVSVANKTLVEINGGGGTDGFTLNTTAAVPGVTAFNLIGASGDDSFAINAVNLPVNLVGAGGDDMFGFGATNGLDSVTGAISIDGGTGTNSVSLDASGSGSTRSNVVITPTGVSGLAGTGANTIAFVPSTVSSLTALGALNFSNNITVNSLGFPLVLSTGKQADSVVLDAIGAPASVTTGAGNDTVQINGISPGLVVQTQDDNDTVSFNNPTGTPGGTLDSFTIPYTIDGGTGTNTVVYNDAGNTVGYNYILGPAGLTRGGSLNLTSTNFTSAKLFGSGQGDNTYSVTGLPAGVSVVDGSGNGKIGVAGDTLSSTNAFVGNGGNDTFAFFGNGLAAATTVDGGSGVNTTSVNGTSGDNAITTSVATSQAGSVAGAGAGTLGFSNIAALSVDAAGGNNSLVYADTATTSRTFNYVPTTVNAGFITGPAGTTSVTFANANKSLTFNGGTNTNDTLNVFGVSTTATSSGPETKSANGVDTIAITDSLVQIQNTTLGTLRSIAIGLTNNLPSVKTLIVRTGNETTAAGDNVSVTPSNRSNIYIYGGQPTSILPGDTLVVNTIGSRSVQLDHDPQGQIIFRVTQLSNGATVGYAEFETAPRPEIIAVGSGVGSTNRVQAYDSGTGKLTLDFSPFGGGFTGGVSVATGDVNGDQYPDIIVGAGPGGPPIVKVFNGITGVQIGEFAAFESTFNGGVQVAGGDVNGDGITDIILGTGVGGGPRVQAVDGKDLNTGLLNFFAYDSSFRNGVQVAVGDLNGDNKADIVTGSGVGGGPHVRAFNGVNGSELANFFAFDSSFRGGVNVTVGDVNGDGIADIVAAPGSGGNTNVYVFSNTGSLEYQFNAGSASGKILPIANEDGVRLAVADVNGDGVTDLVTARGRGTLPAISVFQLGTPAGPTAATLAFSESVFDNSFTGGVYVG